MLVKLLLAFLRQMQEWQAFKRRNLARYYVGEEFKIELLWVIFTNKRFLLKQRDLHLVFHKLVSQRQSLEKRSRRKNPQETSLIWV